MRATVIVDLLDSGYAAKTEPLHSGTIVYEFLVTYRVIFEWVTHFILLSFLNNYASLHETLGFNRD
jgi:hypothetical protein